MTSESVAYNDMDLYVPEENLEAVSQVASELGTIGTTDHVIEELKNYYQENYPYTVRPGKTPKKKDFVNYFLLENKKGYCSYFASAAVLIFRYMGIPARYVEGYAIDYDQILSGELVDGADYADYYDGYSEIGETAYVKVDVTDADAHAWVEVYDPVIGWYPVDVTPSSSDDEDITNFWDEFADFMGGDESGSDTVTENGNALTIPDNLMRNIVYGLAVIAAGFVVFLLGKQFVLWMLFYIRFAKASYNDKLILYYSRMVKRYEKRHTEFATCKNYENQIQYMLTHMAQGEARTELEPQAGTVIEILISRASRISPWKKQPIKKTQDPRNRDGKYFMEAPDVVEYKGEYYLFYSLSFLSSVAVAKAKKPEGPFEYYGLVHHKDGRTLGEGEDKHPFDPAVFIDDDGEIYLYSGSAPLERTIRDNLAPRS